MEEQSTTQASPTRRSWLAGRRAPVAGGVAAVLLAGGIGVAAAQSSSSPPTTAAPPGASANLPPAPGPRQGRFGGHMGGPGGFGPGFEAKGALHGELVMRNGADGFRTVDVQTGEATAVSSSSITVKSEDGFTKTYTVDENTLVNAGRDGIGDVKTGHTVRVNAVVEGNTAHAVDVNDETSTRAIHDHWAPPRAQGQSPPTTTR